MAGHGKLCFGYSNDPAIYVDRVPHSPRVPTGDGCLVTHRA